MSVLENLDGTGAVASRADAFKQWLASGNNAWTRPFELGLAALSLAAGGYIIFSAIAMVNAYSLPLPDWDQWSELINWDQFFSPTLYAQHNEHRILVTRLLLALDAYFFRETNRLAFICVILFPLTVAVIVMYATGRGGLRKIVDRMWIAGVALALLFSAMQYEIFTLALNGWVWFGIEAIVVVTFVPLVLGKPNKTTLIATIVCEIVAAYTMAGGILVPFLAIPAAFLAKRSKTQVVVLAVVAILLLASYLNGYVQPGRGLLNNLITYFRDCIIYAVFYIGNPFAQIVRVVGDLNYLYWAFGFGVLGLALYFVAAFRFLFRRVVTLKAELFFLAIGSWVLGMDFMATVGRVDLGIEQALERRYTSPGIVFWTSMVMLWIVQMHRLHPRLRPAVMGAILPLLLALAGTQHLFVAQARELALIRQDAMTTLLANVDDDAALSTIFPDPEVAMRLSGPLRVQRLSIFADNWTSWLGTNLTDHVQLTEGGRCRGAIDDVWPPPAKDHPGWRAAGQAWDIERQTTPRRIVLANDTGRVVGFGMTGFAAKLGERDGSGWHGHFAAGQVGSVTAYALLDQDSAACPLGRVSQRLASSQGQRLNDTWQSSSGKIIKVVEGNDGLFEFEKDGKALKAKVDRSAISVLGSDSSGRFGSDGNEIVWSDRQTWWRAGPAFPGNPTYEASANLLGTWIFKDKFCRIEFRTPQEGLTVKNENGVRTAASVKDGRIIVGGWQTSGAIVDNATKITWPNGTVWQRLGAASVSR